MHSIAQHSIAQHSMYSVGSVPATCLLVGWPRLAASVVRFRQEAATGSTHALPDLLRLPASLPPRLPGLPRPADLHNG